MPSSESCDILRSTLDEQISFAPGPEQVTLSASHAQAQNLDLLRHLYKTNCQDLEWIEKLANQNRFSASALAPVVGDRRSAVLAFMMAATPDDKQAQQILDNFSTYLDNLRTTMEADLVGNHPIPVEYVHDVPGTVNPVKVSLAYTQAPQGGKIILVPVWKVMLRALQVLRSLIYKCRWKLRCKITGMRLQSLRNSLTVSFLWLTGHPIHP